MTPIAVLEDKRKNLLSRYLPLFGFALFGIALFALHHALGKYHYREISVAIANIPSTQLLLSLALASLGYLVLSGYDALGFRYLERPFGYAKLAQISFIGYAFSNNIGFASLAGGGIRLRMFSGWGLSALEIAKLVAFLGLTFWLGFLAVQGIALGFARIPEAVPLHVPTLRALGALFLAAVVAYLVLTAIRRRPLRLKNWEIEIPSFRIAVSQITVSALDWCLVAATLYVLMPTDLALSFPAFLSIFLTAQMIGLLSHVPGGLGVFESVMLLLLHQHTPAPAVAAALLAFRLIYYVLPLAIASVLMGAHEALARREQVARLTRSFGGWITGLLPSIFALTTFAGGAILMLSGATPAEADRLVWLRRVMPLPLLEFSHLIGSLAGAALLILAWGLRRRLDAAYQLALGLLVTGAAASLLKGLDYEEAMFLFVTAAALLPCRREFYRKASLASDSFSAGWISAIGLVIAGTLWLGTFSFKHVEYSSELWWHFAFQGDAPRFLRASVGAVSLLILIALYRLLRPAPVEPNLPDETALAAAERVIEKSSDTGANLALLADKDLLFSESGNAFIMYGVERRSWVALGDPVGADQDKRELVWRFREMCDRHDGWPVFYEIGTQHLHLYLDLGLGLMKLGEEARVPLANFSLEGAARKGLRYTVRKLEKVGVQFEWVPVEAVTPLLPELRAVSDAWLAEKHVAEKSFSLGRFDEAYLRRFPIGVVRLQGRVVAFSNLWPGADKEELSPDLMRFAANAPSGTMEYLFVQMMLAGRERGFGWFNLGIAPLSGLENRALAPLWSRLGAFIFRHGEHFYNFQGLRQYKEKFDPQWTPRYMASPGGLALPVIMTNVATLISGSLRGVVSR